MYNHRLSIPLNLLYNPMRNGCIQQGKLSQRAAQRRKHLLGIISRNQFSRLLIPIQRASLFNSLVTSDSRQIARTSRRLPPAFALFYIPPHCHAVFVESRKPVPEASAFSFVKAFAPPNLTLAVIPD